MSPNTVFPLYERPRNDITERIIKHPRVTHHVQDEALVLAIKDELLVSTAVRNNAPHFHDELSEVAEFRGSLNTDRPPGQPAVPEDVEKWSLKDEREDSVDHARRLRQFARDRETGAGARVPAVTPNHVTTVTPFDHCPATPPHPVPPPSAAAQRRFVEPIRRGAPRAEVVVIDTGYIRADHPRLNARVRSIPGQWFDTRAKPPAWVDCAPDAPDADGDDLLDGIAGHGTFVAGIVARGCRQCRITVVGQRHEILPIKREPVDQARLFSAEYEIARSLLLHSDAQVVLCGFAFPTLDGYSSIAFNSVMQAIREGPAPRCEVAVVAPAGNEASAQPYWPAAHPDVVGVAAANRRGNGRAWFSNWGSWLDCCTRGQDVFSTFIDWTGRIDGAPDTDIEDFQGWATWNGTSFAAPKAAAAIAKVYADSAGKVSPVAAFRRLVAGNAGVAVTPLADVALPGARGVALPYLTLR